MKLITLLFAIINLAYLITATTRKRVRRNRNTKKKGLGESCNWKLIGSECQSEFTCAKGKDGKSTCKYKLYKKGCKNDDECSEGICFGAKYKWELTACMDMSDD